MVTLDINIGRKNMMHSTHHHYVKTKKNKNKGKTVNKEILDEDWCRNTEKRR